MTMLYAVAVRCMFAGACVLPLFIAASRMQLPSRTRFMRLCILILIIVVAMVDPTAASFARVDGTLFSAGCGG
ncbi:hypothetical protein [Cupriavidus oxalaticus]|uniref:Uncharacterized protein n=1 Tax=Cupriavidus oxalaticus TaxID=96344 RepID=A0A375FKT4_9BURK|nr:hypothetical protein [Cupriavidus oxalaticus]QEZ44311.1 hypothetical protein D2917_08765 [Cupriavidus oxalaticus]QRQ84324.1 hypothetical protein JTE91_11185 [Cupriavidus oxalaticus]QRQ91589.1 hypothetical protein JTE92_01160 [Cupriavidus oxalaticus]WQD86160.1 hypothetical protein U0036_19250 [Cupriavidus oxalaticus]SPC05061.1 conserved hypothetical protein [Cupriavidus oxalaticus]